MIKKIAQFSVAMAIGLGASITTQAQVYSNIVGFQVVTNKPGQFNLVGNPWANPTNNLDTVIGDQVVGNSTVTTADAAYFWDNATSQYTRYFLGDNIGAGFDGVWLQENYTSATNIINISEGFWVVNNSGATNVITLTGDVVVDPTVDTTIEEGLNMLSYPYSADVAISNLNLRASTGAVGGTVVTDADAIWTWDSESSSYVRHFLGAGIGPGFDDIWLFENYTPATTVIEAGEGFWYSRKGGEPQFTWTENIPYDPDAP